MCGAAAIRIIARDRRDQHGRFAGRSLVTQQVPFSTYTVGLHSSFGVVAGRQASI